MPRMARARGAKGAATWCAMAAVLSLLCRTALQTGVSALMNAQMPGASLQNPMGYPETAVELLLVLIGAASIALPVFWLLHSSWLQGTELRLARPTPWSPVFSTVVFLGLANLGNVLSGLLARLLRMPARQTELPASGPALAAAVLALCILPAVGEELLFRGALQGLMRPCGSLAAIAAPALLFALLHLNLPQFIPALLSGLFLGWLAERTGSILPGMLLHLLNNALAVGNLYLQAYAPQNLALGLELCILLGFPLAGAWMLWCGFRQGFSFADGMRPGARLGAVFASPVYTAAAALLAGYTVFLTFRG